MSGEAVGAILNPSLSAFAQCRQPILRCADVSATLVLGSCLSGFLEQLFPCLCLWFHCSSWLFWWWEEGKKKSCLWCCVALPLSTVSSLVACPSAGETFPLYVGPSVVLLWPICYRKGDFSSCDEECENICSLTKFACSLSSFTLEVVLPHESLMLTSLLVCLGFLLCSLPLSWFSDLFSWQ